MITPGSSDVAVLDVNLPDGNGVSLGLQLQRADPDLASFRDCDTPEQWEAVLREAGAGAGGGGGGGSLRVELYGVARARTGRDAVVLAVPSNATLGDALALLAGVLPELVGPVIGADRQSLAAGSVASLGGKRFLRDPAGPLPPGKPLLLLPASSGG